MCRKHQRITRCDHDANDNRFIGFGHTSEAPIDELIERWHEFSEQSKEEIAAQFNDDSRILFAEFFTKGLGDTGPQGAEWASAEEFAERVLNLRSNEKAWSRHRAIRSFERKTLQTMVKWRRPSRS